MSLVGKPDGENSDAEDGKLHKQYTALLWLQAFRMRRIILSADNPVHKRPGSVSNSSFTVYSTKLSHNLWKLFRNATQTKIKIKDF